MLVAENRPRNLSWVHAGPLLFGDWGTSRLYVLGLAFYYTGHASVAYLCVMSVIMAAVAWAYTVVCRCFPDGGGVYAAARRINPTLAVIGATLLLCDYTVTASLSAVEGFHYIGLPHSWVVPASLIAMVAIALVNWLGSQNAGRFALPSWGSCAFPFSPRACEPPRPTRPALIHGATAGNHSSVSCSHSPASKPSPT
jgi:K+ transporter